MRKLRSLFGLVLLAAVPLANADNSQFISNGSAASSLETAINDFLLSKSVQDFGFSIYQQGRNDGEFVSSSPDMDFVSKHGQVYCSVNIAAEKSGFSCKPLSGVSPEDAKLLEMGDINFSTLLEPAVYTKNIDAAAQNLIRNIINPFPTSKFKDYLSSAGFIDNGKMKGEYAQYMANQAILGVALYSMNEMYGMRVSGETLGITSSPAKTSSMLSVMENEATRRFETGDFAAFLADANTDQLAIAKEMAAMQAFALWMDYQKFRQNERIEALLAANLAKMVRFADIQEEVSKRLLQQR